MRGAGPSCAAAAGLLGALAACSAKLALGAEYLREVCVAAARRAEAAAGPCAWVRGSYSLAAAGAGRGRHRRGCPAGGGAEPLPPAPLAARHAEKQPLPCSRTPPRRGLA